MNTQISLRIALYPVLLVLPVRKQRYYEAVYETLGPVPPRVLRFVSYFEFQKRRGAKDHYHRFLGEQFVTTYTPVKKLFY